MQNFNMLKKSEFIFFFILISIFFISSIINLHPNKYCSFSSTPDSSKKILLKIDHKKLIQIKGIGNKTAELIKNNLSDKNTIYLKDLKKINGIGEKRIDLILKRFYVKQR